MSPGDVSAEFEIQERLYHPTKKLGASITSRPSPLENETRGHFRTGQFTVTLVFTSFETTTRITQNDL